MYCSSCGVAVTQGLSYCKYCGAKLNAEKGTNAIKASEVKPVVEGMAAVLIFGFVLILFLMIVMQKVGFNLGQIFAVTILSFLIVLLIEGVFSWLLLRGKLGAKDSGDASRTKEQDTKELDSAQGRVLPEAMPSVTEHTTRAFEPIYNERKSK